MKICVNYDLINSVKNVNEPYSPLKLVRNKKAQWAKINLPMYLIIDLAINKLEHIPFVLAFQFSLLTMFESITRGIFKLDEFKDKSEEDLRILAMQLQDLNVKTDYDLLKESKLDDREYKIRINEHKIPEIVENKYILVPSYDYKGDIKDTSIEQEHVVGSNDYVLSLGSKKRQRQLAYSNI